MRSAVDEGLRGENPCSVRGAGKGSKRRSLDPLTPAQVQQVADQMRPEWRLGVLLGAWCALRSGEVRELRRGDVDLDAGAIKVRRAVTRVGSELVVSEPKTDAGRRTVWIPAPLLPLLVDHLDLWAQPGDDGLLVWDTETGGHVHDGKWLRAFGKACVDAEVGEVRFHDLRHVGLTYLAAAGATLRELQQVAGHTSTEMAMRYQEVAADHMAEVVARLGEVIAQPV